jgi:hypothetical protein
MATSHSRGHQTYWDGENWRYCDNSEIDEGKRPCKRCGRPPTSEGYDACLGYIEGATSACCGHGAWEGYVISGQCD